jgi:predicted N-acetyltransferase YhbS
MAHCLLNAPIDNDVLNTLFHQAWPHHETTDFTKLASASLFHFIAFADERAIGFVRVIGCGNLRGFLLGPTVHPDYQRQGVGTALLNESADAAKARGVETLHVEFAPGHRRFYAQAGFRHTAAGIRKL